MVPDHSLPPVINTTTQRTPPQKAQSNSKLIVIAGVVASLFLFWYLHLLTLNQMTQLSGGLAMPDSLIGGFSQDYIVQLREAMDDSARGQLNYVHKTAGTLFPLIFGFSWLLLIGTNVARKSWRWAMWAAPPAVRRGPPVVQCRHRFRAGRGNARRRFGGLGLSCHRRVVGAVPDQSPVRRAGRVPWQEEPPNSELPKIFQTGRFSYNRGPAHLERVRLRTRRPVQSGAPGQRPGGSRFVGTRGLSPPSSTST